MSGAVVAATKRLVRVLEVVVKRYSDELLVNWKRPVPFCKNATAALSPGSREIAKSYSVLVAPVPVDRKRITAAAEVARSLPISTVAESAPVPRTTKLSLTSVLLTPNRASETPLTASTSVEDGNQNPAG